uniref:AlNc14C417G11498 protein n=1 Tax=Albugo laibachii Nc14 TaxID=890382 RepID=F0WZ92_9STRA|nr:AlNc14C417G11498 [Albugo laibachii Nc14]CCA27929.1 AlNc14C845G12566 [Albugo laibachii Nc14]|eukprot:CCA27929.1 AlNc14C845G12566 [Albugo laibachii Nc14]
MKLLMQYTCDAEVYDREEKTTLHRRDTHVGGITPYELYCEIDQLILRLSKADWKELLDSDEEKMTIPQQRIDDTGWNDLRKLAKELELFKQHICAAKGNDEEDTTKLRHYEWKNELVSFKEMELLMRGIYDADWKKFLNSDRKENRIPQQREHDAE